MRSRALARDKSDPMYICARIAAAAAAAAAIDVTMVNVRQVKLMA